MTYAQALSFLLKELEFIQNKKQEAYWILTEVCKKDRFFLQTQPNFLLSSKEEDRIREIASKRKSHFPLQYLLGSAPFMDLSFKTCEGVLIPREETAVLVEQLIKKAPLGASVLEIGVGSGIISIALKKYRPDLFITGVDINPQAILCSQENEKSLLRGREGLIFKQSDLYSNITAQYDIILSNPPYITQQELLSSDKELLFEPQEALVAKEEGLYFYKEIIRLGEKFLKRGGFFAFEISPPRKNGVIGFLGEKYLYEIFKDVQNKERVMIINPKEYTVSHE